MAGYILSILGIVIAGIIIDIIVPSGNINKYIKSIYAIFVVAVILSPLINYLSKEHDLTLHYDDYQVSEQLLNYISKDRVFRTDCMSRIRCSSRCSCRAGRSFRCRFPHRRLRAEIRRTKCPSCRPCGGTKRVSILFSP